MEATELSISAEGLQGVSVDRQVPTKGARRDTYRTTESATEVRWIVIANCIRDRSDGEVGLLEEPPCFSYAKVAQVVGKSLAELGGHEMAEVPTAVPDRSANLRVGDTATEVLIAEF